jgi:prefoldin subunit 5
MITVAEMSQWFRKAFNETQSQMLAEATGRLHEDLVRREDFARLTATVERLGERTERIAVAQEQTAQEMREVVIAQKETARELQSLAVAQSATQGEIGELTSNTKAMQGEIRELTSTTKVIQREIGELTSTTKVVQSQIGELTSTTIVVQSQIGELTSTTKVVQSQIGELTSTSMAAQEQIATLAWSMKDVQKQVGGLAQSVGCGLEAYAMERIPKILARQIGFVEESSGPEQFATSNGSQDDIDVVVRGSLAGRPVVFLCETKTNVSAQEVRGFLTTADRVRPQVGCDDVRVFYFAYRASPEARAAVQDVGGYLAFPHTILVKPAE